MPTFSNQATLSYNSSTVSSNTVTGEVVSSLSLIKTALSSVYAPGDVISYAISISNSGENDFTGLTLTDDLGGYAFNGGTLYPLSYEDGSLRAFVNGTAVTEPVVTGETPLVIEDISVPAGGNALIIYSARVNNFAQPCGGTITNIAAFADGCPCAEGSASAEVETVCEPRLSITKQLCPAVINRCDEPVTFTFIIRNDGCCPAMANAGATVQDTFDPPISITSVTFNGNEWTEPGFYTYNGETGEFATVSGQITVPAATYSQNTETGEWTSVPGESVLVITGTFCS